MVGEEVIWAIPDVLVGPIKILIYVLQAAGVFVILYIAFSLVNTIIGKKRNRIIDKIASDVEEIKFALVRKK